MSRDPLYYIESIEIVEYPPSRGKRPEDAPKWTRRSF
jgi:hypothetical protein